MDAGTTRSAAGRVVGTGRSVAVTPGRPGAGLAHHGRVTHLPTDVRAAIRFFAFYLANDTLDVDLLDGIDYRDRVFRFGSDLEMAFAIFTNVLEVDEEGRTLNDGEAQYRVAQWIRMRCDPDYTAEPPFEAWETELHGP